MVKQVKKIEWTKSGTTTSYIGGADWSQAALFDGWGEEATETEIKFLTDKVQAAFHRQAEEAGSSASWIPYTSEVIHDINEPDEFTEKYSEWRFSANEEVWNKYCSGEFHIANLMELTGQESGIIIYQDSEQRPQVIVCNWSSIDGFPRIAPGGLGIIGLGEDILKIDSEHKDFSELIEDVEILYSNDEPLSGSGKVFTFNQDDDNSIIVIAPDGWN